MNCRYRRNPLRAAVIGNVLSRIVSMDHRNQSQRLIAVTTNDNATASSTDNAGPGRAFYVTKNEARRSLGLLVANEKDIDAGVQGNCGSVETRSDQDHLKIPQSGIP
jgi:hypothetical protein